MLSRSRTDRERVRIDFKRSTLNTASNLASRNGESLSDYVERLIEADIAEVRRTQRDKRNDA